MEYGLYGLLLESANRKYDDLRYKLLECDTVKDLRCALGPHVKSTLDNYVDYCYGTAIATADSLKNELYNFECLVCHISKFGMRTIEKVINSIVRENF